MNYRGHCTVNILAGTAIFGTLYQLEKFELTELLITSSVFVVSTFLLSPDLDLKHSRPSQNWGLLRILWLPYQWIFRHRGISHSLLFGSATRILYLSLLVYGVLKILGIAVPLNEFQPIHAFLIFLPIFLSDFIHVLTDKVWDLLKFTRKTSI